MIPGLALARIEPDGLKAKRACRSVIVRGLPYAAKLSSKSPAGIRQSLIPAEPLLVNAKRLHHRQSFPCRALERFP